jgi:hypothetical protein
VVTKKAKDNAVKPFEKVNNPQMFKWAETFYVWAGLVIGVLLIVFAFVVKGPVI